MASNLFELLDNEKESLHYVATYMGNCNKQFDAFCTATLHDKHFHDHANPHFLSDAKVCEKNDRVHDGPYTNNCCMNQRYNFCEEGVDPCTDPSTSSEELTPSTVSETDGTTMNSNDVTTTKGHITLGIERSTKKTGSPDENTTMGKSATELLSTSELASSATSAPIETSPPNKFETTTLESTRTLTSSTSSASSPSDHAHSSPSPSGIETEHTEPTISNVTYVGTPIHTTSSGSERDYTLSDIFKSSVSSGPSTATEDTTSETERPISRSAVSSETSESKERTSQAQPERTESDAFPTFGVSTFKSTANTEHEKETTVRTDPVASSSTTTTTTMTALTMQFSPTKQEMDTTSIETPSTSPKTTRDVISTATRQDSVTDGEPIDSSASVISTEQSLSSAPVFDEPSSSVIKNEQLTSLAIEKPSTSSIEKESTAATSTNVDNGSTFPSDLTTDNVTSTPTSSASNIKLTSTETTKSKAVSSHSSSGETTTTDKTDTTLVSSTSGTLRETQTKAQSQSTPSGTPKLTSSSATSELKTSSTPSQSTSEDRSTTPENVPKKTKSSTIGKTSTKSEAKPTVKTSTSSKPTFPKSKPSSSTSTVETAPTTAEALKTFMDIKTLMTSISGKITKEPSIETTKETKTSKPVPSATKTTKTKTTTPEHSNAARTKMPKTSTPEAERTKTDQGTKKPKTSTTEPTKTGQGTKKPKVSTPEATKNDQTTKRPKISTVTGYVSGTQKPVLILETTSDKSRTTTVPDEVTVTYSYTTERTNTEPPAYCDQPCPDNFWDSGDMCYHLAPITQSGSYTRAISYCQLLNDKTDIAWTSDIANSTLNKQFINMLEEAGIKSDFVFYNEKGSKTFRAKKRVNVTSLSQVRLSLFGEYEIEFVINDQIINMPVDERRGDISAFCRTPRFCERNRCAFADFVDAQMEKVVGLPNGVPFLKEGDQVVLPCIRNDKAQTVRTRCSSYGTWVPHPTLLKCDSPAHPIVEEEIEFDGNPRLQTSCSACYKYGTDQCLRQENGLFKCICKTGWTRFTCWKSPNMCQNVTNECGVGKCRNMITHYECECPGYFFGERCQHNKTSMTLFGTNGTVTYLSWATYGQVTMSATNLILLFGKVLAKMDISVEEPDDPQETYSYIRKVALSMAGLIGVLWKNPQLLGVDAVSCRVFWILINHLYAYGIFMAVNEAINFYSVVDGLSRNAWGNFEGKVVWYFSYRYRVYYAFSAFGIFYSALAAYYWTYLVARWTCLPAFSSPKDETSVLTTLIMLTLALLGFAFGEAGCMVLKHRPHGLIKVKAYFENLWPCYKWLVNKVVRNKYYVPFMPMVLFFQWYYLVRSTDEPSFYFEVMAFATSILYSALNIMQTMHCSTGWVRQKFVIFAMCHLPKSLSPKFEEETWRNRDEVLAKYNPDRYAREQNEKKEALEAAKEKEKDEIRKKNQELLKKNPNLPQSLLYHIPEEGPVQCEDVPLNFDMTHDDYIPDYCKKVLLRRWTRIYLEYRSRAFTVNDSVTRVLMEEMRKGLLKTRGRLHKMEMRLYNHWCHLVPDKDKINIRNPQQDRVILLPEGNADRLRLLKFDRLIFRVVQAARHGLLLQPQIRQTPENPDVKPFRDILNFMKWQFPNKVEVVDYETMDRDGDPADQTFLKGADLVTEKQFEEWDLLLQYAMDDENWKFDQVYEDDYCFAQYIGTPFEEHAREFFNVRSKFCPDGERLANPRGRPIDDHYLDDMTPGFIGPQPRNRVTLGPYEDYIKKASYYQSIIEQQWAAVLGGAARQRRDRHMRTGRGEFLGAFDGDWRAQARMYLWRLFAKDD